MSRLTTPASIDAAPASARPLLEAVNKQIGSVPNLFRLVANSPAALEGYLGMSGALAKGSLPAATREVALRGAAWTMTFGSFSGLAADTLAADRRDRPTLGQHRF